jgi:hypothetical protein
LELRSVLKLVGAVSLLPPPFNENCVFVKKKKLRRDSLRCSAKLRCEVRPTCSKDKRPFGYNATGVLVIVAASEESVGDTPSDLL